MHAGQAHPPRGVHNTEGSSETFRPRLSHRVPLLQRNEFIAENPARLHGMCVKIKVLFLFLYFYTKCTTPFRVNVCGSRQEPARVQRRGTAEIQCRSYDPRRVATV